MALALFDLDNTLLGGDSDYLWGRFLAENHLVNAEQYHQINLQFYQDYQDGCLDIQAFLRFVLEPLTEHSMDDLLRWRAQYLAEKIEPIILPKAIDLVESHRARGDTLMIITATNRFITQPIAERFGVTHLIATEPAIENGRFTGEVAGEPSFREGKVKRLQAWLASTGHDLHGSVFYSDSHNDLPLLEQVQTPVAVDPDDHLRRTALDRGWDILSLRS